MHGLPPAVLPFVGGQVAAEVATVEHTRDGKLGDDGDDGAESHFVLAAGRENRVGFRDGEAVAGAFCHGGRTVRLVRDGARDGMAALELDQLPSWG